MKAQATGLSRRKLKVDKLFTETFTCDRWRLNADSLAEDKFSNKSVN
jgi:hypothetical protein